MSTENSSPSGDTLPQWLASRYGERKVPWERLSLRDRTYWRHEAAAVRRAVERGGFKAHGRQVSDRPKGNEEHYPVAGVLSMRPGHRPGATCTCGWHSHTRSWDEHWAQVCGAPVGDGITDDTAAIQRTLDEPMRLHDDGPDFDGDQS